jgi:DNA-binding ferritin-like protein
MPGIEDNGALYMELIKLLSTLQVFRMKLLGFHWNCRGRDFYATHLLLERLYETVDGFIDRMAESTRKFGVVPAAMCIYAQTSIIAEELSNPVPYEMLRIVAKDSEVVQKLICDVLEGCGKEEGVANLLGEMAEAFDNIIYLSHSSL